MDLFNELSSTRTQELKEMLDSITKAIEQVEGKDDLNYLLFTRVAGKIEEIILEREVNILLNSLTVETLMDRVAIVRGINYAA